MQIERISRDLIEQILDGATVTDGVFTIPLFADLCPDDADVTCAPTAAPRALPAHPTNGHRSSPANHPPVGFRGKSASPADLAPFIAGPENQLLAEAVHSLLGQPPSPYNPLLLHGAPGTGKTHVALGLCRHWRRQDRDALYSSAADFARGLATAIDQNAVAVWQARRRDTSLFVLEEVNQLGDKPAATGELLHTIDALLAQNGQVVLTSRLPPERISGFPKALRARIASGLVVHIAPPSPAARLLMIERFAEHRGIVLPKSAARALADGLRVTACELHGALNELALQADIDRTPLDAAAVREYLGNRRGAPAPSVRSITALSAKYFGIRLSELTSPTRRHAVVQARNVAIYLARQFAGKSLEQLGEYFGGRDHTTVLHGYRMIERRARTDPDLRHALAEISQKLSPV